MRIYLTYKPTTLSRQLNASSLLILKQTDIKLLDEYYQDKYDILHFDTDEGIFEIINNKIYKLIENVEYEQVSFTREILLNLQPNNIGRKEIFYIPIHYKYNKLEHKKYRLTPTSILTLIVENNNRIYFETNENEITESIKEDMITFLSLLKLYK